ncbi:hypothetical protein MLD52_07905 [Puniceicoccaceae bacterium K14]|nr:hypothetical protein [Puniceicoccaceae bacterium K14]
MNKKKVMIITGAAITLLAVAGSSYAYIQYRAGYNKGGDISGSSGGCCQNMTEQIRKRTE